MPDPIQIIVQAQTKEAAAALQQFVTTTGTGLQEVTKHANAASAALGSNRMAMMELGHSARSVADGLAAGISPLRMLAMEAPRIMQAGAAMSTELRGKILSMLPVIGTVAAAVGAAALIWKEFGTAEDDSAKKADQLTDSLSKIPEILQKINILRKAGILSPAQADEYTNQINRNKKLYVDVDGNITPNPTSEIEAPKSYQQVPMGAVEVGTVIKTIQNREATPDEVRKHVTETLNGERGLNDVQTAAIAKLHELEEKSRVDSLTGIEKEKAAIRDKYATAREAILEQIRIVGKELEPNAKANAEAILANNKKAESAALLAVDQQKFNDDLAKQTEANNKEAERQSKDLENAIVANQEMSTDKTVKLFQVEYETRVSLYQGQLAACLISEEDFEDKVATATKERIAGEKQYNAELQRQADLRRTIARGHAESNLQAIRGNPFLTEQEKTSQSTGPLRSLMADNQGEIGSLTNKANTTTDEAAKLDAQNKIVELMRQQVELQQQLDAASGQNSFVYTFLQMLAQLRSEGGTIQQQMATIFGGFIQNGISSISNEFTKLIEGTTTWNKALLEIGRATIGELINGFIHMGVQWVAQHTIMLAASKLLHLGDATATTIGEAQKTGVVVTMATVRKLAAINEAEGWLASAAMQAAGAVASIPYFGPALALAAMGSVESTGQAIIGASSLGQFYTGGYTGDGGMFEPAGIVHRGEFVFDAVSVDRIGVGNLEAIRRDGPSTGEASASAPSQSSHRTPTPVVIVNDRQELIRMMHDPAFARPIVAHVFANRSKLGIRT